MPETQPQPETLSSEQLIADLKEQNRLLLEKIERLTFELDQAKSEASTDFLTKLPNRKSLSYNLDIELEQVYRGNRLAVAMVDLDNFKRVNDKYGHAQGDQIIKEFSNKMQDQLRGSDIFGRFGGEEFLALLPISQDTSVQDIEKILNRYRDTAKTVNVTGNPVDEDFLSISIGCVIVEKYNSLLPKEILNETDQNLYHSKHNGRDQFTISRIPSPPKNKD